MGLFRGAIRAARCFLWLPPAFVPLSAPGRRHQRPRRRSHIALPEQGSDHGSGIGPGCQYRADIACIDPPDAHQRQSQLQCAHLTEQEANSAPNAR